MVPVARARRVKLAPAISNTPVANVASAASNTVRLTSEGPVAGMVGTGGGAGAI